MIIYTDTIKQQQQKQQHDETNNNIAEFISRHAAAATVAMKARKNKEENNNWHQQTKTHLFTRSLAHIHTNEKSTGKWIKFFNNKTRNATLCEQKSWQWKIDASLQFAYTQNVIPGNECVLSKLPTIQSFEFVILLLLCFYCIWLYDVLLLTVSIRHESICIPHVRKFIWLHLFIIFIHRKIHTIQQQYKKIYKYKTK